MGAGSVWVGSNWTAEQRAWYVAACQVEQRDEVVGVLFALFLGSFGAHHFYLRRTGLGVLYLLFFWTGIPAIVSFVECFFMPGRVRRYNWHVAQFLLNNMAAAQWAAGPGAQQRLPLPRAVDPHAPGVTAY